MLPRGTVHLAGRRGISQFGRKLFGTKYSVSEKILLRLSRCFAGRVAKDLSIHAPDAVVDFEFRSGRMLPVKVGNADIFIAA